MNRPLRTGKDSDEARGRILEAAEEQFRRVGYHRISVVDIASAIARTNAPATEKLGQLLAAVHHHNKMMLVKARPMHELIVAATQQNWPIIKAHIERMVTIFEAIIREGVEAREFDVDDTAEAARAVRSAFMPFFHPVLIEHCVQHGEDTEAALRDQIRYRPVPCRAP